MTFFAAFLGASAMGLVWIFVACGRPKVVLAKMLIMCMGQKERSEIHQFIKRVEGESLSDAEDEVQSVSSQWLQVSEEPNSPAATCSFHPGELRAEHSPCEHAHTTTKGSNAFQKRVRCRDCGCLLSVEQTKAGKLCHGKTH